MKRQAVQLSLVLTPIIVFFAMISRQSKLNATIDNDEESFFDISSWKEENVAELFTLGMTLSRISDNWPILPPKPEVQKNARTRRRLNEGAEDKWEAEANEMKQEVLMFQASTKQTTQINKDTSVNTSTTSTDNEKLAVSRNAQELPDFDKVCTDPAARLPCPPRDISQRCDKYNNGDFLSCFEACKVSVCCIHDSRRQQTLSCADTEPNCRNWLPCYIVWWKLSDTIGPAPFLRVVQVDDFFNVDVGDITEDINDIRNEPFYSQLFQRWNDEDDITLDDEFFLDPSEWPIYA